MKTSAKRFFLLVLAAAMVLPLFCVAPAFAAEEAAATTGTCQHDYSTGKLVYARTTYEYDGTEHVQVIISHRVCAKCGYEDTRTPIKSEIPGTRATHSFSQTPFFALSRHDGHYSKHVWIYQQHCDVCSYFKSIIQSAGCNEGGCSLDPMSMTPEIM